MPDDDLDQTQPQDQPSPQNPQQDFSSAWLDPQAILSDQPPQTDDFSVGYSQPMGRIGRMWPVSENAQRITELKNWAQMQQGQTNTRVSNAIGIPHIVQDLQDTKTQVINLQNQMAKYNQELMAPAPNEQTQVQATPAETMAGLLTGLLTHHWDQGANAAYDTAKARQDTEFNNSMRQFALNRENTQNQLQQTEQALQYARGRQGNLEDLQLSQEEQEKLQKQNQEFEADRDAKAEASKRADIQLEHDLNSQDQLSQDKRNEITKYMEALTTAQSQDEAKAIINILRTQYGKWLDNKTQNSLLRAAQARWDATQSQLNLEKQIKQIEMNIEANKAVAGGYMGPSAFGPGVIGGARGGHGTAPEGNNPWAPVTITPEAIQSGKQARAAATAQAAAAQPPNPADPNAGSVKFLKGDSLKAYNDLSDLLSQKDQKLKTAASLRSAPGYDRQRDAQVRGLQKEISDLDGKIAGARTRLEQNAPDQWKQYREMMRQKALQKINHISASVLPDDQKRAMKDETRRLYRQEFKSDL